MKGMGKAMMGTGEAEGEKRAEEATSAALLNPLIDEYSLRDLIMLLVNITGGSDLTLFEVDEAVNKIRAEVDPEAELIFGAIEDENLTGKIRVSIVATSLDGQEPEIKPVVSMVHRIHNRNTGYNNNSSPLVFNQSTFSATEGATAFDMDTNIEKDNVTVNKNISAKEGLVDESLTQNISLENATSIIFYIVEISGIF
jgi:cell division protein FtsZ